MSYIYVYHTKSNIHVVGVFINEDIEKGQIIGVSHVEYEGIWYMTTHGYYNHSKNPNCIIETKDNINLSKAKAKVDLKLGDKLNAQIQGYGKTKSLIKGDNKLKGAGVKGRIEYQRGRHAIEGKGEFRPDRQEGSAGLTYKFKF